MDQILLSKATPEQLREWGRQSARVREAIRLQQEPPLYRPAPQFVGFVVACSFQTEIPMIVTTQLFHTGRYDSFRAIIDGEKQHGRGGWYSWMERIASQMPRRLIQE